MLSKRELTITALVAEGLTNKEIADHEHTTEHVIKNYLRSIYDKSGFSNRVELSLWYVKQLEDQANEKNNRAIGASAGS